MPHASDWQHTTRKRDGSISSPNSRRSSRWHDSGGVSPGKMRPPANHQSGWGWTCERGGGRGWAQTGRRRLSG
jgi:hypothetical protein